MARRATPLGPQTLLICFDCFCFFFGGGLVLRVSGGGPIFFAFFFGSLFLSLSLFFFLLCFCFTETTTLEYYMIDKVFFINPFSFWGVFLSSCFLQIPFPYLRFFPDFKFCFCSTSMFSFKNASLKKKTLIFGQEGGCNITDFLKNNLCFAKSEKLSFCLAYFCRFLLIFKKTVKIGNLAHI